ncbi:hypothetical protein Tco_0748729 [Tanacetum coccineum]|uniref:Uncharacterized protein n=1 Tax=Tanacetum coccineum TaxID=301880 RepID=A0ABQ4YZE8_9ASTR
MLIKRWDAQAQECTLVHDPPAPWDQVAFGHYRDAFSVIYLLSFTQDLVMSDSEDSTVTYTAVSSPFEGLSDIGSPGVDGPPVMPEDPYAYVMASFQASPSPDYVPGPEEPEQAPLSSKFIPEPVYPEFMPLEDDALPAEEQPLPAALSPNAKSLGYIDESYPDEDLEDPVDYLADEGDDEDDDESSDDDDDDDDVEEDEEDEEEEEEENPALVESVPPPPVHCVTARMSIREQPPTPFWFEAEIARLLDIPSPPPSLLSLWSSPLPQIPSPLPVSPPLPVSSPAPLASPTYPLGYRAAMIRLRAESPSTSHPLPSSTPPSGIPPLLPIPLPTPSPPFLLPSTDCKAGVSEVTLLPRKRLCIALGMRYEVGERLSAPTARPSGGFRVDYVFVAILDDEIRQDPERDVGYGITDTWAKMLMGMPGALIRLIVYIYILLH